MNVGEDVDVIADARVVLPATPLPLGDEPHDVHLRGGVVADIAPAGALPRRGRVLDAAGGWLIPGLWDHHVHVMQWALVAERMPLRHAESAMHAAALMSSVPVRSDGRRIGTGYRDALWNDAPDLATLDAATGEVPTYLINADVHSVWLNSAALRREGIGDPGDGVLREEPAFAISRRLNAVDPTGVDRSVASAARDAAARGLVGVVDLDMAWNEQSWQRRTASGFDLLRVDFGIYPADLERAIEAGLRTGAPLRGANTDLVRVGPVKVISDGSLGTRTAACSHPYTGATGVGISAGGARGGGAMTVEPADVERIMAAATAGGLTCAIHAIGDVAVSHALDAFTRTGAAGSIEHAQLVAHADLPRFARVGVAASVQPEHALDDRDISDREWAAQTALAYPLRSLADAGATVLFGSDAPVADLDPWAGIAAAVYRARAGGPAWHPEETVSVATALQASTRSGTPGADRTAPGVRADFALCATDPRAADEQHLRDMQVAATLLGGRLTHLV
ncbi:amidohydrolase family protein [Microbacterium sp. LRZ72]|uniref:amidohydrolase n=1 Tax=Microbacterium sp. LRZ72 TaxID=2942481 RepID=UPI0029B77EE4|nr:amidohydrolase family protein [Microbacterium sp. LRZ72]MDX2375516.1 amidohydrolase family protein [Microbacterium sp. LRZ72]